MIHALHGNFGLPSDWAPALPPGVPATAWHLWEIRRQHPETSTLTGFATWFNNQIEALPPAPFRLLAGYSLGGRLALHILLDRPWLWNHCLILSAHPGLDSEADRHARAALDKTWKYRCTQSLWQDVCAAWNEQPVLQSPAPPPGPQTTESWRTEIAGAFQDWSLAVQENLLPRLIHNQIPGTWLTGSNDPKFDRIAQACTPPPSAFRHHTIPGAGHRLLQEKPELIRSHIEAIIEDLQTNPKPIAL